MILKKLSGRMIIHLTDCNNTKVIFSVLLAKDEYEPGNFMSFTYDEPGVVNNEGDEDSSSPDLHATVGKMQQRALR